MLVVVGNAEDRVSCAAVHMQTVRDSLVGSDGFSPSAISV